jgi:dipeptidyl aminopeptidase/acylaminoacyl peptidase
MTVPRLILLWVACLIGQATAAVPPSLADFAATPQFGHVSLSPDGRHVAIARLSERGSSLLIVDADTVQPTTELAFPPHSHVLGFAWANDEMLVVNRGERFAGHSGPGNTGDLYAIHVDGGRGRYLFGTRAARGQRRDTAVGYVIDPLRNDREHVLIIEYRFVGNRAIESRPRIHRVNVYSGGREQIAEVPLNYPWITTDLDGRVRFAYGMDDARRYRTLQLDEDGRWQPVELGLGAFGSIRPLGFAADGASFHATISQQGEAGCLYRIAVADFAREQIACESVAELDRLMPSAQRGVPLAALYSATGPRTHLLAPERPEAELLRVLAARFAPATVEFLQFSNDGSRLLLEVSGDREPGRLYLFDLSEAEALRPLFARAPQIDPAALGPAAPFSLRARDGTPLHGFLTLPPGAAPSKLPLVVLPHGGPYGVADDWRYDADTQLLATRGHAVLRVNFRGSSGYGELFTRQGYREWAGAIQDDIVDATRWAIDQGLADPARICIVGGSFGAYSALMSAIRAPELYRCAVGLAGAYDMALMVRGSDIGDTAWGRGYVDEVIGGDAETRRMQSPTHHVERLEAAVLLLHGDADQRTPIANARALAAELRRHGKQHELVVVPNEGHGFYLASNRELYYEHLLRFLARHIGARSAE